MTVANLHEEFCTAFTGAVGLLGSDDSTLDREQSNELKPSRRAADPGRTG